MQTRNIFITQITFRLIFMDFWCELAAFYGLKRDQGRTEKVVMGGGARFQGRGEGI